MKKAFLLLFVVFLSTALHSFAENILLITNPKSGETDVFRKGSFLVFELKADNSTHEGLIRNITDSAIVFDYAQVSFSEMRVLAGTTKSKIVAGKIANGVGTALIIAGSSTFNCGLNFFYGDYYYWPIGGTIWMAGAFVAGLGYMLDWAVPLDHHVRVRNYRGWESHISNDEHYSIKSASSDTTKHNHDKPKKRKSSHGDDVYGD